MGSFLINSNLTSYPYSVPNPVQTTKTSLGTTNTSNALVTGNSTPNETLTTISNDLTNLQNKINSLHINLSPTINTGSDTWNTMSIPSTSTVANLANTLGRALKPLTNILNLASQVLKIIQLFSSIFGSFAKLLSSVVNFARSEVDSLVTDFKIGVYANLIVPPGFNPAYPASFEMARGGFQAFVSRLQSSINNIKDPLRPNFSNTAEVGGIVILIDDESIDNVWTSLKQLDALFGLSHLGFNFHMTPPPPKDIKGTCVSYKEYTTGTATFSSGSNVVSGTGTNWTSAMVGSRIQTSGSTSYTIDTVLNSTSLTLVGDYLGNSLNNVSYSIVLKTPITGIHLEWEASSVISSYYIYRSPISKGTTVTVPYFPDTLLDDPENGQPGLLTVIKNNIPLITSSNYTSPTTDTQVYSDPEGTDPKYTFNGNKPLPALPTPATARSSLLSGTKVSYDDFNIDPNFATNGQSYYYVIQSGLLTRPSLGAKNSVEVSVAVKTCNDAVNTSTVIQQPNGNYEFLSAGLGQLNNWTSIQASGVIPWLPDLVGVVDHLLDSFNGIAYDASDAILSFINQIVDKIKIFTSLINNITYMLTAFKVLLISPSFAVLTVPAKSGGTVNFVNRIRTAKLPAKKKFSGSNGATIGLVLMSNNPAIVDILNDLAKLFI